MPKSKNTNTSKQKSTLIPILIIAGLFFIFGFVTWINGALIPFMKTINELTTAQSYLVASALLIMAISGGAIIPPLYGRFVDGNKADLIAQGLSEASASAQAATSGYWILLPCYIIILYYAISGHKLGLKK